MIVLAAVAAPAAVIVFAAVAIAVIVVVVAPFVAVSFKITQLPHKHVTSC